MGKALSVSWAHAIMRAISKHVAAVVYWGTVC